MYVGVLCLFVVLRYFVSFLVLQSWMAGCLTKYSLSYDVGSGSEITPCSKIDKPLVVYRFSGNVITSIIMTQL